MNLHDRGWAHRSEDVSVPIHVTEKRIQKLDARMSLPTPWNTPTVVSIVTGMERRSSKLSSRTLRQLERLLALDAYSLAMEFVRGEFSVEGDLVAAVHFYQISAAFLDSERNSGRSRKVRHRTTRVVVSNKGSRGTKHSLSLRSVE